MPLGPSRPATFGERHVVTAGVRGPGKEFRRKLDPCLLVGGEKLATGPRPTKILAVPCHCQREFPPTANVMAHRPGSLVQTSDLGTLYLSPR